VGRCLWVQTPARSFPIEPHYLALFVHWFPKSVQRKCLRWLSLRGWIEGFKHQTVDELVDELRLLSYREMRMLFPDCTILRERALWIFTKSYIAFREPQDAESSE
jgi:hypothetical protein